MSAKNYENRLTQVTITAKDKVGLYNSRTSTDNNCTHEHRSAMRTHTTLQSRHYNHNTRTRHDMTITTHTHDITITRETAEC